MANPLALVPSEAPNPLDPDPVLHAAKSLAGLLRRLNDVLKDIERAASTAGPDLDPLEGAHRDDRDRAS